MAGAAVTSDDVKDSTGTPSLVDVNDGVSNAALISDINADAAASVPSTVAMFISTTVDPAEIVISIEFTETKMESANACLNCIGWNS